MTSSFAVAFAFSGAATSTSTRPACSDIPITSACRDQPASPDFRGAQQDSAAAATSCCRSDARVPASSTAAHQQARFSVETWRKSRIASSAGERLALAGASSATKAAVDACAAATAT